MSDLDCARAEELLSDVLEGTLDQVLRVEVEAHLASCPDCSRLRAALEAVVGALRGERREPAPPPDLAERSAKAALAAARAAVKVAPLQLPPWVPALAAGIALVTTLALLGLLGRGSSGGSVVERAAKASVYLTEKKDRVVEDLHLLRVVIATLFEGRLDRVNDLVDDYRRRQQKRQQPMAPQKTENIHEGGLVKSCEQPGPDRAAAHDTPAYFTHSRAPRLTWHPNPRQGVSAWAPR